MNPPFSTLYALWPHSEPPLEEQVRLRLDRFVRMPPLDVGSPPGLVWSAAWERPGDLGPTVVMAATSDVVAGARFVLGAIEHPSAKLFEGVRWVLCLGCVLSPDEPLRDFREQLRLLREICPEAQGVFDVDAQRVRSIAEVDTLVETGVLTADDLYLTHVVHDEDPGEGLWLHTHGLERTGFPDVEILGVPPDLVEAGFELIRHFVGRFLVEDLPPEGDESEIIWGHFITWRLLEAELDAGGGAPGLPWGAAFRSHEHLGARIALVNVPGRKRKREWGPPLSALRAFASDDDPVVLMTPDHTMRLAQQALAAWGQFGLLFVDHRYDKAWRFSVCIQVTAKCGNREHLWFEVENLRPGRIQGQLISTPLHSMDLEPGKRSWLPLDDLVTWSVEGPDGVIRPVPMRFDLKPS